MIDEGDCGVFGGKKITHPTRQVKKLPEHS
jgi:hypothetical protein